MTDKNIYNNNFSNKLPTQHEIIAEINRNTAENKKIFHSLLKIIDPWDQKGHLWLEKDHSSQK